MNESARLNALTKLRILDTPAEQAFDEAAMLIAAICCAPIALISLIDHRRQWFKARFGISETEASLEQSVCRHALYSDEILVIDDLTKDVRTSRMSCVTGALNARFYAGAAIKTQDLYPVGVVCVVDRVPRLGGLTEDQSASMSALARHLSAHLWLRQLLLEAA